MLYPMEVNDELIQELSELARLRFQEEEREEIKIDLQRMISFVEKLNELDTDQVEPLIHMTDERNPLREDQVIPSISREEGLSRASTHHPHYFFVPKVIKK
ncbi:MAG: Asp-tRNA(Asn)/Glu-tRNA(Gln) amidotransferase subunit GatC [Chitinophagaceae bacterium]